MPNGLKLPFMPLYSDSVSVMFTLTDYRDDLMDDVFGDALLGICCTDRTEHL